MQLRKSDSAIRAHSVGVLEYRLSFPILIYKRIFGALILSAVARKWNVFGCAGSLIPLADISVQIAFPLVMSKSTGCCTKKSLPPAIVVHVWIASCCDVSLPSTVHDGKGNV